MALPPPPRSRSAGMRSIRRELQRRRLKLNKPTAKPSAAKTMLSAHPPPREDRSRSSAVRERHRPPLRRQGEAPSSSTTSHAHRDAAAPPQQHIVPVSSPAPPLPFRAAAASSSSVGSACRSTPADSADARLKPGTVVGVRTRTARLKTGQVLVLWMKAMIVSSTDDGGYEVVYEGNWPPGDPYGTVRVPRHHVRLIKTTPPQLPPPPTATPSVATSSCASAATTATVAGARNKKMRLPEPRPTTAGKNLRLIRSLVMEMELP